MDFLSHNKNYTPEDFQQLKESLNEFDVNKMESLLILVESEGQVYVKVAGAPIKSHQILRYAMEKMNKQIHKSGKSSEAAVLRDYAINSLIELDYELNKEIFNKSNKNKKNKRF